MRKNYVADGVSGENREDWSLGLCSFLSEWNGCSCRILSRRGDCAALMVNSLGQRWEQEISEKASWCHPEKDAIPDQSDNKGCEKLKKAFFNSLC